MHPPWFWLLQLLVFAAGFDTVQVYIGKGVGVVCAPTTVIECIFSPLEVHIKLGFPIGG